jgi:hypothetical protein
VEMDQPWLLWLSVAPQELVFREMVELHGSYNKTCQQISLKRRFAVAVGG